MIFSQSFVGFEIIIYHLSVLLMSLFSFGVGRSSTFKFFNKLAVLIQNRDCCLEIVLVCRSTVFDILLQLGEQIATLEDVLVAFGLFGELSHDCKFTLRLHRFCHVKGLLHELSCLYEESASM